MNMDLVRLGQVADYMTRCGINIKVNPAVDFIEAMDTEGAVHLYYPESQSAVFRRGAFFDAVERDLCAEERKVDNLPLNKFAYVCKHPEVLKW